MTSVSGHLQSYDYLTKTPWNDLFRDGERLFNDPIKKFTPDFFKLIQKNIEAEIENCHVLIIWTDCDREGENIGAEIRDIALSIKPDIIVKRAHFSEITKDAVQTAILNLKEMDQRVVDAVDVRQQLDLRIGASFTILQTVYFKQHFSDLPQLLSYGTCQFPTLGFIVSRHHEINKFDQKKFWKIELRHQRGSIQALFNWVHVRTFDHKDATNRYNDMKEAGLAKVTHVKENPVTKTRPTPLETIEMSKKGRMLGMSAKEVMTTAETLYTKGYISYPRTETNIFTGIDLKPLVQEQVKDKRFTQFANIILKNGIDANNGKKSDKAHPPIHPLKCGHDLQGREAKVYDFITRRFLATISRDAAGHETVCKIEVGSEKFTSKGLVVTDMGYLDIYTYEKWSDKILPQYTINESFPVKVSDMALIESSTNPPALLSEPGLISLMDQHGIGTDATQADHIETVKKREYASLTKDKRFLPTTLGIALVEGYEKLKLPLAGYQMRSDLEKELVLIENGTKTKEEVLREQLQIYLIAFQTTKLNLNEFKEVMSKYYKPTNKPKCKCGSIAAGPFTVKKDGPTKGQTFFTCSQRKCNFFEWLSTEGTSSGTNTAQSDPSKIRNKDTTQKQSSSVLEKPATPDVKKNVRKCSVCGEPGHTKRNCPTLTHLKK